MTERSTRFIGLFLILLSAASPAFAHALWIEKSADGVLSVRFGEYENDLREKGEKLDTFKGLEAWSTNAEGVKKPLAVQKQDDRFALDLLSGPVTAQDVKAPVKDMKKYKLGIAKPFFYTRYGAALSQKPETRLDVLTVGTADSATVYFDGVPLAGEKATWVAPNGWTKEYKTDEKGQVKLDRPWPGLYVLEVTHVLEKPGVFEEKPYEVERHRATLAVEKA